MNTIAKDTFVPAAGVHWLTPVYDPALALLMRERVWRPRFLRQVAPRPGERILDLGCGTGTLTVMLHQACPDAEVIGLDIDPQALGIARAKADAAGAAISFLEGRADGAANLPPALQRASLDKVVSCLLFHHLQRSQKVDAFSHANSLLRSGGTIHVADWGRPANPLMRQLFYPVQALDGFATTSDNVQGRLPEFMRECGFASVTETHREATVFGTLSFYMGVKP